MHTLQRRTDTLFGATLFLSVTFHVAAFVFMVWMQRFSPDMGPVQTTYYVDVVNLPVASPQKGSPSPGPGEANEAASAPQVGPMSIPKSSPTSHLQGPQAEAKTFQERMAKLEGKAEEQRQAAALESLRQRVAGGKAGMPNASGTQAGSDYTAFIHSRLKDAFQRTISYQSKAPFVVVRLTIGPDGKLIKTRIEKSSGDRVFENSVQTAITFAEQKFVPPPGRTTYEGAFVFKPQGVLQK